jgi:hypothetical protein
LTCPCSHKALPKLYYMHFKPYSITMHEEEIDPCFLKLHNSSNSLPNFTLYYEWELDGFARSFSTNSMLTFGSDSTMSDLHCPCPAISGPASSCNSWSVFGNAPRAFGQSESSLSICRYRDKRIIKLCVVGKENCTQFFANWSHSLSFQKATGHLILQLATIVNSRTRDVYVSKRQSGLICKS